MELEDFKDLVGQPLLLATGRAMALGIEHVRVVKADGKELMVTMELKSNRLNVEVRDGIVTAVRSLG